MSYRQFVTELIVTAAVLIAFGFLLGVVFALTVLL